MTEDFHLVINGRQAWSRVAPRLNGETVMIPLRVVVESCGGIVEYLPGSPSGAVASLDGRRSELSVGSVEARVASRPVSLPVPPAIVDDTLLVPAEALRPLGIAVEVYDSARACLCASRNSRLAGRRIFLDPGHGGSDPGAIGSRGMREARMTLDVAQKCVRLLTLAGATPFLSRTTDRSVSLATRVTTAQSCRAQAFLSIHGNSFSEPWAHGTETYYFEFRESQRLAALVQQELVSELGLTDRGVKEASFYVLRHARMPACLAELAFLSNPQEEELLSDPWFRLKAAMALFRGLRGFVESGAGGQR
ncbi:MAG: N-acetylmuramoyl-L-alanine amidase [Betaproteobacteria bacterium]